MSNVIWQYCLSCGNFDLNHKKQELLGQIRDFPIKISARDFFCIDRNYLAGVNFVEISKEHSIKKICNFRLHFHTI